MGLSHTKMYSHTSLGTSGIAPLLTWTTGTTDPTPDFQIDFVDAAVSDIITLQISQSSSFSSGVTTATNTLDSGEVLAATITEAISSPLADGTWYARCKRTRGSVDTAWSNTETKTLNSAPYMTSATSANNTGGTTLSFALTASQSSTFAITGGADSAKFEISGSTLRWLSNGTKNYSAPDDVGTNNTYIVDVTPTAVADSEAGAAQTITITVVGPPVTISYTDHAVDSTDLTTYTFASRAIGTASATRYVVVAVAARNSAATVSSATIGGVSATIVQDETNGSNNVALLIANVPTGTTGTVAITWSAGQARCGIGVYALDNLGSAVPTSTAFSTVDSGTVSLTVVSGSVTIGVAIAVSAAQAPIFTWTGLTENYDENMETNFQHSGASVATAVGTSLTIGADQADTATSPLMLCATWGPA